MGWHCRGFDAVARGPAKRRLRARVRRAVALGLPAVVVSLVLSSRVTAQDPATQGADSEPSSVSTSEADYETLRGLLGLSSRAGQRAEPIAAPEAAPPVATSPAEVETPKPEAAPASAKPAVSAPASSGKPYTPPSKPRPRPIAPRPEPTVVEQPAPVPAAPPVPGVEIPPDGTIVSAGNMDRWKHLLGPSIQWAVAHGATLAVIDPQPAPYEPTRQRATERYSAQVKLAPDKRSMENYVAGIPFPTVTTDDPDVAIKVVFNFEARTAVDDLDLRKSSCDTCQLTDDGVRVEKHYLSDHLRRLFYVGRLHQPPMPTWQTQEGFRYREMVAGLLEPFDLRGAGYTYARYLDPNRQDDSWVYYPSSRRVRRLSTAQRSEGVFGTDIDLDSFAGYAGNPAWATWEYLGTKTVLASLHARSIPVRFLPAPADFFPDDVWEPRDVHIIVGTPRFGGSSFSRRVLYIDKESLLIPYAEIYDRHGGLWKGLVFTWRLGKKATPTATRAVYDEEMAYHANFSIFDMQLNHATRCESPGHEEVNEEGWYYNFGAAEGTDESVFSIAGVIGAAH